MFGIKVAMWIHAIIFIPFLIGVFRYHKLPTVYRIFMLQLLAESLLQVAYRITYIYRPGNNLFLTHFYAVFEIILTSIYLRHQIRRQTSRQLILILIVALSVLTIVYAGMGDNLVRFSDIPKGIEHIYFSMLICYVFYEMSLDTGKEDNGLYIINGAMLFWFSSSFLIYAFSNLFIEDMKNLLIMHNVATIVAGLCSMAYAVAMGTAVRSSDSKVY
jgi:hypothetical protein